MLRSAAVAALAVVTLATMTLARPLIGQTPPAQPSNPGMGQRRFQPPPDHWMTIDSLSQALGLNAAQRTTITPAYTALHGVMKDAAKRREAIRQQMQGTFTPGQPPTPEQRAKFDSVRTEMEGFQAEADQWLAAIRNDLTAEQQAKFDALPKPRMLMRRGMGGEPPRQ